MCAFSVDLFSMNRFHPHNPFARPFFLSSNILDDSEYLEHTFVTS